MLSSLIDYLGSIKARDPAPRSHWEILLYPGVWAVGWHRVAHWLFEAELYFLARAVNHFARATTAIDIHPGAKIGKHLFIDHGFTVIVGSGAQILGPVTVGARARIGANAVVTKDVMPGAVMVGIPAKPMLVDASEYARDFVPYGTCCDNLDPQTQKLELLACQLIEMQKRIGTLMEERDAALADKRDRA